METREKIYISDSGWRAIYAEGFTLDRLEAIVEALVSLYPKQRALIGFDNRFLSEEFAHHLACFASEKGWTIEILDQIFPTPGVGTWVKKHRFDFGLVITASHNPYYYNGIKILDRHGGLIDRELADMLGRRASEFLKVRPPSRLQVGKRFSDTLSFMDARKEYLEIISGYIDIKTIRVAKLKVGWDAFGGTDARILPEFLDSLGIQHESVPMFEEPTYQKRRLEPDATSLKELGALVRKTGAIIGVATDVDGDRFSAVDEHGNYLQNNPLGSLLVWYLLRIRGERGTIYQTVSCSSLTERICRAFDVPLEIVPVGFQKMGQRMIEDSKALIGIEETGGLAYAPHLPFKDGLVAQALLLEMLATQKKTVTKLISQMQSEYGNFHYDRVDLQLPSEADVESWLDGKSWEKNLGESLVTTSTLDGIKWSFRSGSWLLIRRSKTEPLLRIYFESEDPKFLKKISQTIDKGEL